MPIIDLLAIDVDAGKHWLEIDRAQKAAERRARIYAAWRKKYLAERAAADNKD